MGKKEIMGKYLLILETTGFLVNLVSKLKGLTVILNHDNRVQMGLPLKIIQKLQNVVVWAVNGDNYVSPLLNELIGCQCVSSCW